MLWTDVTITKKELTSFVEQSDHGSKGVETLAVHWNPCLTQRKEILTPWHDRGLIVWMK